MANKKKNNKNVIIGGCIAAVVIAAIILAVVFAAGNGTINDSYFVSDGSKYVINNEYGDAESDSSAPIKNHIVYYYSGDKITGAKAFYEYVDETAAKNAYETIKANAGDSYKSVSLSGIYVILEANESEYEGLSASDVKQQVELLEQTQSEASIEETSTEETIEEDGAEETNTEEAIVEENQ